MRTVTWLLTVLLLLPSTSFADAARDRALAIAAEVERIAAHTPLWPGFEPLRIPLAIYTGERTFLFRHPAPPDGFTAMEGAAPAGFVYAGRHPAMVANSSHDIAGTVTATLLADRAPAAASPTRLAAVALHETFHVYQRRVHPSWSGNEGELFLYPAEDAALLALRRLESDALARALAASDTRESACWVRRAGEHRQRRFAAMPPTSSAYERATELNEGLAAYVQLLAEGSRLVTMPADEFPPAAVRARTYVVGPALALLLDRHAAGWQSSLERDDAQHLDAMLVAAVGAAEGAPTCAIDAAAVRGIEERAQRDAAALVEERAERRRAFDTRPGWRVTVRAAAGRPLWPKGFDPLNVDRLGDLVLHTRMLQLANEDGELRAIDEAGADLESTTAAAGAHPLFNGVSTVVVAGLGEPKVETRDGRVTITAPGFTASFARATAHADGHHLLVEVGPGR